VVVEDVDAAELPLPDADARRRLIRLYQHDLVLDLSSPAALIACTEGVTASFLKELLRRAAMYAAEDAAGQDPGAEADRGDAAGRPLTVRDAHMNTALDELLDSRNQLTRALLGGHAAQRPPPTRSLIDLSAVARARASLSAGGAHQADRPGAGTAGAGSGDCGGPCGPARRAQGKRSRPGTGPAAGRHSAVTCRPGIRHPPPLRARPAPARPVNPFAVRHHRRFVAAAPAGGTRTRRRLSAAARLSSVKPARRAPAQWCRPAVRSASPRCTARRRRARTGGRHASAR
jgi:hypothetical protein